MNIQRKPIFFSHILEVNRIDTFVSIDLRVNDNILLPDDETKFLTGQQTQIVIILSNFTGVYISYSY